VVPSAAIMFGMYEVILRLFGTTAWWIFIFVSLPTYIPHCSTMHFGASIDWKREHVLHIYGGMKERALRAWPLGKGKGKEGHVAFGRCLLFI
jgi:hypothetical protein